MKRILFLLLLLPALMSAQEFSIPPYVVSPAEFRLSGQEFDYWWNPLKVTDAHKYNRGEKTATFILDTSGEFDHPDIPTTGNKFGFNATPEDKKDGHGHGHMVGSLVAMIHNDIGGAGIAPDVLLIPVKVMRSNGQGFSNEIAAGIRYCADADLGIYNNRVRVLNLSLGAPVPIPEVEAAINYAISKGCIIVAANGNSGCVDGQNSNNYPGAYEQVISVASIGKSLLASSFSSCGPGIDVTCFGEQVYAADNKNGYTRVSGSSFTSPEVAAILSLVATEKSAELRAAGAGAQALMQSHLRANASDLGPQGPDNRYGYGLPDAMIVSKPITGIGPPPPSGPPEFRNVRTLTMDLPPYVMLWRAADQNTLRKDTIFMTAEYTSKFTSEYAVDALKAASDAYNQNRGFVLLAGDDLAEAAFWWRHFYEMILKQRGYNITLSNVTIKDVNSRSLKLGKIDRRSTTASRLAASHIIKNNVSSFINAN